jgi:hypothetical protein
MAEKVAKVGVKKTAGYLYFVDRQGDISRAKMARGGQRKKKKATRRKATSRKSTARKASSRKTATKRRRR